ncbi:hypothetical protein [Fredinandcohnia quinoae]|uniref:Uncharacterized protein n=1 Tax=Fredinandcohnia quinoae TaxID=2918902 RepID=A0AAW5EAG4_9BACI|nr:hypothetical protein [Fredinandcohnia sp. SECRCQ15]MCH1627021.1 hypothetical protein [Fredinandcohnia sp. SECRCQ15]
MVDVIREDWLKNLRVGDLVGIKEVTKGNGNSYTYSSDEIIETTDSSFTVSSGMVFNANGMSEYVSPIHVTLNYEIVPLTEDVKKKGKFSKIEKLINLVTNGGMQ